MLHCSYRDNNDVDLAEFQRHETIERVGDLIRYLKRYHFDKTSSTYIFIYYLTNKNVKGK